MVQVQALRMRVACVLCHVCAPHRAVETGKDWIPRPRPINVCRAPPPYPRAIASLPQLLWVPAAWCQ